MFTTAEAAASGITRGELRWGEWSGRWVRIVHGVYAEGNAPVTALEREVAVVVRAGGIARGALAGVLHGLDAVELDGRPLRRSEPEGVETVGDVVCGDVRQTLLDLASGLDDHRWEQALESALRRKLVTVDELTGTRSARIQRVPARRPAGAPATESLLETLMVQLIRRVPELPEPERQVVVNDVHGRFVARVDLAFPALGLFVELDGEQHAGQPVYDARRETAVVAATGWLCGRFTWSEVTRVPVATARRLAALAERARERPLV